MRAFLLLPLLAMCALAQSAVQSGPGFSTANMDPMVNPCVDFYQYACKLLGAKDSWIKDNEPFVVMLSPRIKKTIHNMIPVKSTSDGLDKFSKSLGTSIIGVNGDFNAGHNNVSTISVSSVTVIQMNSP